jgi:hypothetical protein
MQFLKEDCSTPSKPLCTQFTFDLKYQLRWE